MKDLLIVNLILAIFFTVCYTYQFIYILIALIKEPKKYTSDNRNRYAVIISARNERDVIHNLIDSIKKQNYPAELIDTFVCADNCTDDTAERAREAGAIVYERFSTEKVGKGHALNYLFHKIFEDYGKEYHNAYLILDADNLLDENYMTEMNHVFSAGHRIITSYRNSKNYGTNWISSGYALWFLREAVYLNNPRMILGTSCAVSGTGFMVHRDIINKNDGWKHFLLTEDIEFSVDNIINGEKIAYAADAMLYDEQPETFSQSWKQRLRWAKGYLQVFMNYGGRLMKSIGGKGGFSAFDMTMTTMPAIFLSVIGFFYNVITLIVAICTKDPHVGLFWGALAMTVAVMYIMYFAIGVITGVTEWNKILTTKGRKIKSFFTFPLFMFTYIPISIAALFRKVEWSQIKHTVAVSINDMNAGKAQNGKDRSDAGKKDSDADGSADGNTNDTDEKEEKK